MKKNIEGGDCMKTNTTILIYMLIILSGCATGTSRIDYTPPLPQTQEGNEIIIDEPFDIVWDRFVGRLAASFFVINNIDKESRLLNISFSNDNPEHYVDCGKTSRQFSFQNLNRIYSYNVAEDSSFQSTGNWGVYQNLTAVYSVNRETEVEGRINIYVAPINEIKTKISVNVRYILTVTTSGTAAGYNAFGTVQATENIPESKTNITFNTGQIGRKKESSGGQGIELQCRSLYTLEKELLDLVKQ